MSYSEIGTLLKRDERTIWNSYAKAKEKKEEPYQLEEIKIRIPIEIFSNEKLTMLEALIKHLKEQGFGYSEISRLINRDPRNVRTIGINAQRKI